MTTTTKQMRPNAKGGFLTIATTQVFFGKPNRPKVEELGEKA